MTRKQEAYEDICSIEFSGAQAAQLGCEQEFFAQTPEPASGELTGPKREVTELYSDSIDPLGDAVKRLRKAMAAIRKVRRYYRASGRDAGDLEAAYVKLFHEAGKLERQAQSGI